MSEGFVGLGNIKYIITPDPGHPPICWSPLIFHDSRSSRRSSLRASCPDSRSRRSRPDSRSRRSSPKPMLSSNCLRSPSPSWPQFRRPGHRCLNLLSVNYACPYLNLKPIILPCCVLVQDLHELVKKTPFLIFNCIIGPPRPKSLFCACEFPFFSSLVLPIAQIEVSGCIWTTHRVWPRSLNILTESRGGEEDM